MGDFAANANFPIHPRSKTQWVFLINPHETVDYQGISLSDIDCDLTRGDDVCYIPQRGIGCSPMEIQTFFTSAKHQNCTFPFTPGSRCLDAAKWLAEIPHILGIHEHHAGFNTSGQTQSGVFILKGDQASDRSKNLFLSNPHSVINIGQHRWTQEVPSAQMSR